VSTVIKTYFDLIVGTVELFSQTDLEVIIMAKISTKETFLLVLLLSIAIACLALAFSGLQFQAFDLGFKRGNDGSYEMTATGNSEVIIASCIGIGIIIWFYKKSRG